MDILAQECLTGSSLARLMKAASAKRDAAFGQRVTYSRKVFIPLTNLCRDQCGYCTFAKQPDEPGAGYLTPDDVLAIARESERLGCKEALLSLGEKPELRWEAARAALRRLGYASTIDYVVAMCEEILSHTSLVPHVNAGTLTHDELIRVKEVAGSAGLMLENISRRLVRKGMAHYACPDKVPVQRLRTLRAAGEIALPMTTGILIGIGETWQERIDSLRAIRELHERYGHIQEVIVQNFRAKPSTPMARHPEPGLHDMLRTLAAARLILPGDISLQAPPNLSEQFERYLDAGINDWGGISPLTADHINPERAWPAVQEIASRTHEKDMWLVERLTTYPGFLKQAGRYLGSRPHIALSQLADTEGYARSQTHMAECV